MATFLDRLPWAMRGPALRAGLTQPNDAYSTQTWLGRWLWDLCDLNSRQVPPDIRPDAFGSVVDVFLTRREQIDSFFGVCPATGLRLPHMKSSPDRLWEVLPGKTPCIGPPPWYDVPGFFDSCPGAEQTSMASYGVRLASEQAGHQQNWNALAERELAP